MFQIYNIKHIRIPLYSAWVGSTWERLIRVVKSCLYKVIGRGSIQYFELLTIVSDIQKAINSRPLTYRCSNDDMLEIITPNCFLQPLSEANLLLKSDDSAIWTKDPPSNSDICESLNMRVKSVDKFRDLWYQDYLLSLREQCKDLYNVDFSNKINKDDGSHQEVDTKACNHR